MTGGGVDDGGEFWCLGRSVSRRQLSSWLPIVGIIYLEFCSLSHELRI